MRNIIVTGGTRGIGLAIGRRLAAGGDRVIAVARREHADFASAAEDMRRAAAGELVFVAADLAETDALPALAAAVRRDFGPVWGLVNNAGLGTHGLLATMHNRQIEALVRLNTLAPMILTKYVVRAMMADGQGRIVNVSSVIATSGYSALAVYGATKASLIGFTRSLAREVGRLGITVNAVAPGFMETDMTDALGPGERAQVANRSALKRLALPEDVAGAVEFLLGPSAGNITGTVLTVDAGGTA